MFVLWVSQAMRWMGRPALSFASRSKVVLGFSPAWVWGLATQASPVWLEVPGWPAYRGPTTVGYTKA